MHLHYYQYYHRFCIFVSKYEAGERTPLQGKKLFGRALSPILGASTKIYFLRPADSSKYILNECDE